jgi:hypothetical protein
MPTDARGTKLRAAAQLIASGCNLCAGKPLLLDMSALSQRLFYFGQRRVSPVRCARLDWSNAVGAALLWVAVLTLPAAAQSVRTYTKRAGYEDVKFELTDAVVGRGLTIDHTGAIGTMLERTGPDVGSTKPLYLRAEFITFCSAKLSRQMIEADLRNVGYCPYVIFIYEAANKPGETVVGYRRPPRLGNSATRKALGQIDALLDGIVRQAIK